MDGVSEVFTTDSLAFLARRIFSIEFIQRDKHCMYNASSAGRTHELARKRIRYSLFTHSHKISIRRTSGDKRIVVSERTQETNNNMSQGQVLGVLIPGGVVRTDFVPSDPSGTKFTLALSGITGRDIASVSELVFFLLPGVSLPQDHGAIIFWQIVSTPSSANSNSMSSTPFTRTGTTTTEFELVGAISNTKPSGAFRTGWATNETLSDAINMNSTSSTITINLGVSIEPMSSIQNMSAMQDQTTHVAKKIATDLFNFMQSFDTGSAGAGNMIVPKNIFERWLARFEAKAKVDPNFFMKSES